MSTEQLGKKLVKLFYLGDNTCGAFTSLGPKLACSGAPVSRQVPAGPSRSGHAAPYQPPGPAGGREGGPGVPPQSPLTARGGRVATRSGVLLSRKARLSLNGTSLLIFSRSSPRTCVARPGSTASALHRVQVWLERGRRMVTPRPLLAPVVPTSLSSSQATSEIGRAHV